MPYSMLEIIENQHEYFTKIRPGDPWTQREKDRIKDLLVMFKTYVLTVEALGKETGGNA